MYKFNTFTNDLLTKATNIKSNPKNANLAEPSAYSPVPPPQHSCYQPTQTPHSVVTKHVSAPIDKPASSSSNGLPAGQNICSDCERLIV